jgi:hypothetical protein
VRHGWDGGSLSGEVYECHIDPFGEDEFNVELEVIDDGDESHVLTHRR